MKNTIKFNFHSKALEGLEGRSRDQGAFPYQSDGGDYP